jgi:hypothetical protein
MTVRTSIVTMGDSSRLNACPARGRTFEMEQTMHRFFNHCSLGRFLLLATLLMGSGACGKSSLTTHKLDSGQQDSSVQADASGGGARDSVPADLPTDADQKPPRPDLLGQTDGSPRDGASSEDAAPDGAPDAEPSPDGASKPDAPRDGGLLPDADPVSDAASSVDEKGDAGTAPEIPPMPSGVVIYKNAELPGADPQCIASTPGWLDVVALYLTEAQKCWDDSDCLPVAFGSLCGNVCVLPVNRYRVGEMDSHAAKYGEQYCTTCPQPASYPPCAPPTEKCYCNAGRCAYR